MGRRAREKKERKTAAVERTQDGREVVSRAVARYIHCSARKMALVANQLRDKQVGEALEILEYLQRPSAVPYVKAAVKSAAANAQDTAPDPMELVIAEIRVEGAPMMKRIRPASMGRAVRVRKRLSHITVKLAAV